MPDPSNFVFQMAIGNINSHKLPGVKLQEIRLQRQVGKFVLISLKLLILI